MIHTFVFSNGTSQLHLKPETSRDERYLSLYADGKVTLRLEVGKDVSSGIIIHAVSENMSVNYKKEEKK